MLYVVCAVDVWSLVFSADSLHLATGSHNGKINLFSVEDGNKQSSMDTLGKFIMSIAYVSHHCGSMCYNLLVARVIIY